jgi:hypothetical protein
MKFTTRRARIFTAPLTATVFVSLFALLVAFGAPRVSASAAAEYLVVGYVRGGNLPGVVAYSVNPKTGVLQGQWTRGDTTGQILSETATPAGRMAGVAGKYAIVGANPNGSRYSGDLSITQESDQVYRFSWSTGDHGVGILVGNVLAVGYGENPGVVIYRVKRGERADGIWTAVSVEAGRVGQERFASKSLVGSHVTSGVSPGGQPYAGRVDITQQGNVYLLNWDSGDKGVGVLVTGDAK